MEQASERGASTWLTVIPLAKYGFGLNKQAFRDAICLRYGWTPERLPSHCPCGEVFTVAHTFSCPKGALPSIRHNQVRDITARLLTEVCPSVGIEPTLQPLNGESFPKIHQHRGRRKARHKGTELLGHQQEKCIFRRQSVQLTCSVQQQVNNKCLLQETREREEKRVRETGPGSGPWHLYPSGIVYQRGMGTFSNCRLQKTGRVNRHKAQPSL